MAAAVAGAAIQATQLSFDTLKNILDAMGDSKRKIAIGVANETNSEWEGLNSYFFSGASDSSLPERVKIGEAALYNARKTTGPVAAGVVGVFTYYMKGVDKTLAVLFSVPFDYNLYKNWWDAKVYNGKRMADYDIYKELYYGNPYNGDDGWHTKQIGEGYVYRMKGCMTRAGTCQMKLKISRKGK